MEAEWFVRIIAFVGFILLGIFEGFRSKTGRLGTTLTLSAVFVTAMFVNPGCLNIPVIIILSVSLGWGYRSLV